MAENEQNRFDIKKLDSYVGRGIIAIAIIFSFSYLGISVYNNVTDEANTSSTSSVIADIPSTPVALDFMTEKERSYYFQLLREICLDQTSMNEVIAYLDINDAEVQKLRGFSEVEQRVYFALLCKVSVTD